MDKNLDDFFTIEALDILEGFDGFSRPPSQPQGFILDEESLDQRQQVLAQPQSRKRRAPTNIPGCTTLNLDVIDAPKWKRRKFEPKRRTEVAKVRKLGACMRCKQMKISAGSSNHKSTIGMLTRRASVFWNIPVWSLCS